MKSFWRVVSCFGLVLCVHADTVELKSGQKFEGTILGFDGKKISVHATIGGGSAELSQPVELVSKIDFTYGPEEIRLLTSPTAADVPALKTLWEKQEPYLNLPGSSSLNVALQYGRALVMKNTKTAAKEALALCARFEKIAPAPLAENYRSLRLNALILSGDSEAAAAEVAKMTEVSSDNIGALVEAKFITGLAASAKMKALVADHPRWQEERDQIKEHRRLYDEALDSYLYPVVLFPEQISKTARGLWAAAELYLSAEDKAHAAVCAQEIVSQFPDPEYLPRAQDLLKKIGAPPVPDLPPLSEARPRPKSSNSSSVASPPTPSQAPTTPTPTPFHKRKKQKNTP